MRLDDRFAGESRGRRGPAAAGRGRDGGDRRRERGGGPGARDGAPSRPRGVDRVGRWRRGRGSDDDLEPPRPVPALAPPEVAGGDGREAARGPARRLDQRARPLRRRRPDRDPAPQVLLGQRGPRGADDPRRPVFPGTDGARTAPSTWSSSGPASPAWPPPSRRGGTACASRSSRPPSPSRPSSTSRRASPSTPTRRT